jgi:hypothetical protein
VRLIESQAARLYWRSWSDLPIHWPRKDERRVPEHWKRFGSRISPLTHSPRLAANPPNGLLNLLYSVQQSESTLAASAMGLLPEIGLLHADAPNRNSLSCDLMEVCRPKVDAFVLNWLQSEPLRKSDFWEDRNGNCRIGSLLAIKLCETCLLPYSQRNDAPSQYASDIRSVKCLSSRGAFRGTTTNHTGCVTNRSGASPRDHNRTAKALTTERWDCESAVIDNQRAAESKETVGLARS